MLSTGEENRPVALIQFLNASLKRRADFQHREGTSHISRIKAIFGLLGSNIGIKKAIVRC